MTVLLQLQVSGDPAGIGFGQVSPAGLLDRRGLLISELPPGSVMSGLLFHQRSRGGRGDPPMSDLAGRMNTMTTDPSLNDQAESRAKIRQDLPL